jgi:ataxia telangiectasia mutated family protein
MSVLRDFAGIVEKLQSDKMKDRTEGVSRCRDFLSTKRNFNALNNDRKHSWIETLQTLFQVVILERNAYSAKQTAPNEKRLDEAANLVRYLAEKIHQVVSRKTAKALINHLTQMIAVHGSLQPYALTYLKTLRTVLSYSPHLEHLDERQWTDIVTLCFSGVLGDKVKIGQEFADDTAIDVDSDPESRPRAALQVADSEEEDELEEPRRALPTPSSSRKGKSRSNAASSSTSSSSRRTANQTQIELLYTLDAVFRCPTSPFLTYASVIFRKFLRFFLHFPTETSAHYPALVALNRCLGELDLNDQKSMKKLGPALWTPVLGLWATKNAGTKEQVLVCLRYLGAFVVGTKNGVSAGGEQDQEGRTRAKELYQAVLSEPTIRWREAYDLDLDSLRVGVEERVAGSEDDGKAFEGKTFRFGAGFDEKQAVSWMTVELGAMALARVYDVEEENVGGQDVEMSMLSPTQRGKRRKVRFSFPPFLLPPSSL